MAGLMLGVGAYAAANPPPDAIYSATQMFFLFEIPFLLVMTAIIVLIGSLHSWLSNIKHSAPQEVAISEDSIVFSGADASGGSRVDSLHALQGNSVELHSLEARRLGVDDISQVSIRIA
jgi:hypothetical protein